jgi:hypothetical protein
MVRNMTTQEALQLQACEAKLGDLTGKLHAVGFISSGSLVRRYMPCGKPGCRCQGDPPDLHGPYWQWTRRVNGKTVTRRLTEGQARLYEGWIANRRHLDGIVAEMEQVSQKASEILLREHATGAPRPRRRRQSGWRRPPGRRRGRDFFRGK